MTLLRPYDGDMFPRRSAVSRSARDAARTRCLYARAAVGVAGTGVVAGAAALTIAHVAARAISGPFRPALPFDFTPFEVRVPPQELALTAADGSRLAAWWMPSPGATRTVILCHGHRGSRAQLLGIGPGLMRQGMNALLLGFRGSAGCGDGPQSLAWYEQQDLRAAIDHVRRERPDDDISVVGYSMGAAVALMVAATDERVATVVADSSFADMRGVITAAAASHARGLPVGPLVSLTDAVTQRRYGYAFDQVRPVDVVDRIPPRPLLLIHGDRDSVVPVSHLHDLAAAAPQAEVWELPGVDHCGAYFTDREGYIARVADFLQR